MEQHPNPRLLLGCDARAVSEEGRIAYMCEFCNDGPPPAQAYIGRVRGLFEAALHHAQNKQMMLASNALYKGYYVAEAYLFNDTAHVLDRDDYELFYTVFWLCDQTPSGTFLVDWLDWWQARDHTRKA